MNKKNIGLLLVVYLILNILVSYKHGVFRRMNEILEYERAHPNETRKTVIEFLTYSFDFEQ